METFELKKAIKEIISEFHTKGIPRLFQREVVIPEFSKINKVIVFTGPRRAGKTYLMYEIMGRMISKGAKLTDFLYINFENERISDIKATQLELILECYKELYPNSTPTIFLDELQNITGWEKFVRRLNDSGYRIFITGSNSRLLSQEIATSLRGRSFTIKVLPLSFREFISMDGTVLPQNWEYGNWKNKVRARFEEYFSLSGFPEVALEKRLDLVDEYFKTTFYRDIVERFKVKNTELMRLLMKYLVRNYGSEFSINSFNNFAKSNGYKTSTSVLHRYVKMLESAYFCNLLNARQKSMKKETGYIKKAYIIDQGFINFYNVDKNPGRLLENIVFIGLLGRGGQTWYFRNGIECDFVTERACIQVAYELTHENQEREITGLLEASKRFGIKKLEIITMDQESEIIKNGKKILIIPIWKWLLEQK